MLNKDEEVDFLGISGKSDHTVSAAQKLERKPFCERNRLFIDGKVVYY